MKLTSKDMMKSLLIAILNNVIQRFNEKAGARAMDVVVIDLGENYNDATVKCDHGHVMQVTVDELFDCMEIDRVNN